MEATSTAFRPIARPFAPLCPGKRVRCFNNACRKKISFLKEKKEKKEERLTRLEYCLEKGDDCCKVNQQRNRVARGSNVSKRVESRRRRLSRQEQYKQILL